jgi:hypothetical protein
MNAALNNPVFEVALPADVASRGRSERYVSRPIPTFAVPQQRAPSGATFWVLGRGPAARPRVNDAFSTAGARTLALPRLDTDECLPVTGIGPTHAATQLLTLQPERGEGSNACAKTGAMLLEARGLCATFA